MAAPRTKHAHELLLEQHAIVKATSMGNVMRMEFDDGHSIDVRPCVNITGNASLTYKVWSPDPTLKKKQGHTSMAVREPDDGVRTGNMDPCAAIEALKAGKILRRFNGNQAQKFYRMSAGTVQVASSAAKLANGDWERAATDINSWANSTFRTVKLNTRIIDVSYDD